MLCSTRDEIATCGDGTEPWVQLEFSLFYSFDAMVQTTKPKTRERKKHILTSFKTPEWPIRPNKRLHLKCCLVFYNNKPK